MSELGFKLSRLGSRRAKTRETTTRDKGKKGNDSSSTSPTTPVPRPGTQRILEQRVRSRGRRRRSHRRGPEDGFRVAGRGVESREGSIRARGGRGQGERFQLGRGTGARRGFGSRAAVEERGHGVDCLRSWGWWWWW